MNLRAPAWNHAFCVNASTVDARISEENISGSVPQYRTGGRLLSNGPGWNPDDLESSVRLMDRAISARLRFWKMDLYPFEQNLLKQRSINESFNPINL